MPYTCSRVLTYSMTFYGFEIKINLQRSSFCFESVSTTVSNDVTRLRDVNDDNLKLQSSETVGFGVEKEELKDHITKIR